MSIGPHVQAAVSSGCVPRLVELLGHSTDQVRHTQSLDTQHGTVLDDPNPARSAFHPLLDFLHRLLYPLYAQWATLLPATTHKHRVWWTLAASPFSTRCLITHARVYVGACRSRNTQQTACMQCLLTWWSLAATTRSGRRLAGLCPTLQLAAGHRCRHC